jgi:hypothetical protein
MGTILLVVREITHIKNIILESNQECEKGENPFCHLLLQVSGMLLGGGIMLIVAIFEHDMMEIL